jgi:UDP-glucose 4-epimerase
MLVVVTGGAGFIGSNLVEALLARGDSVRVLDDLSGGHRRNVPDGVDLIEARVDDGPAVARAVEGADAVLHQAAHRAVLRSVEDPLSTDTANVHGTLTVLKASADAGVARVVYASSSSVYGGAADRPTPETAALLPRSPYAVTKLAGEHYCRVFAELYGLETVALRYFNVFGPRQRPDSAYAAVIPLFIDALKAGRSPEVQGDGGQSRDFTFVSDVVAANLAALHAPAATVSGRAYNIAGGREITLLEVLGELAEILGVDVEPTFVSPRAGDVRHSCADVGAAARDLGFTTAVSFRDGLERTVEWLAALPA